MHDQQTIEIENCKPFSSKDKVKNDCITAIMYNAGRKAEVLDEFGVWALGNIKKSHCSNLLKYFLQLCPMYATGYPTKMMQIYA
mgnify:CR=1 FL=1